MRVEIFPLSASVIFPANIVHNRRKRQVTFLWAYYGGRGLAIISGNKPNSFSYQTDLGWWVRRRHSLRLFIC